MTNEQHIENLKKLKSFHNGSYGADIDRAIKALEQESCGDAINRQETIEAFQMFRGYEANRTNAEWVDRIETVVKKLPPVKPQESMREFTEKEAKAYSKALDKMYKPTGFNVFNELCDDAISRQAVNTLVDELARAISDERCCMSRGRSIATIMQDILDLSSVNPQPKTGHWMKQDLGYKCSNCTLCTNEKGHLTYNYCPNCGAKMVEPQESEE